MVMLETKEKINPLPTNMQKGMNQILLPPALGK